MNHPLRAKAKKASEGPGVYLMKNQEGEVIYVGKAKNLKNRISSYFVSFDQLSLKTQKLVEKIADFETIQVFSEVEALILERNLIRHHKPVYNILLRDDKNYPFIRVQLKDEWPRFEKVRKMKDDGALYLGPYPSGTDLYHALNVMYEIFPLIRCSPYDFAHARRPCHYYHMKKCLAPCVKEVDNQVYRSFVQDGIHFLKKDDKAISEKISQKMFEAAKEENFELAALYRDQLAAFKTIRKEQKVLSQKIAFADVIGFYQSIGHLSVSVLMIRHHELLFHENFILPSSEDDMDQVLSSFLMQFYLKHQPTEKIFLPLALTSTDALEKALALKSGAIKHPKIGEANQLVQLAHKNAKQAFTEFEALENEKGLFLKELAKFLLLEEPPKRMECIDISHTQGTHIVGSAVVFIDGKPEKKFYRRYKIKTLTDGQDDYAAIFEVVTRRCQRAMLEKDAPDLLIIDGGKGQLAKAIEAKSHFPDVDMRIISLAKARVLSDQSFDAQITHSDERIFLDPKAPAKPLIKGSYAFRVLSHIRDEAHRFALMYHRHLRDKIT